LEKLEESHPVSVHWRSYELRPKGAPPISAEYRARIEEGRPRLYAIARQNYGLEMNPGPFGFDSRPALIAAKYAEQRGVGPAYHAAVMRAYWLEAKAIDQVEVLGDIFVAIGLERDALLAAITEEALVQAVLEDEAQAQAYGINGVPAMVFVDKYLVSGAQPYDVLTRVVDQVAKEMEENPASPR
jgi:predicted DsbA family dithiol-disulfide isomerase